MAIQIITKEEIASSRIEGNLPDKPTQASLYGEGGMTPREVKAAFDKLPLLIAASFNALVESIGKLDEDSLAEAIPTGMEATPTLRSLFTQLVNGELSQSLALTDGSSLNDFYLRYLQSLAKSGESAPDESTQGDVGSVYLMTLDGNVTEIYFCKGEEDGKYLWQKYVAKGGYYIPSAKDGFLTFTPTAEGMPAIEAIDLNPLPTLAEEDEGKVLTAEGGTLLWKTITCPQVPTVSQEDNGKFLRVVDGQWEAATIPDAEGVTF